MTDRPSLLILSFSPLIRDARLLKQIRGFAAAYDVTTCGYGPRPDPAVTHVEVFPSAVRPRVVRMFDEVLALVHLYRAAFERIGYIRGARRALAGRRFDAVLANDADAAALAVELFGAHRVHADLHEHWPTVHADVRRWRLVRAGYYRWLVRRFAARAASVTTVSEGIADEYTREFGMPVGVVVNATPLAHLAPTGVHEPLKLVYSGMGSPVRGLETLVRAAALTHTAVAVTLYLVGSGDEYLRSLQALIDELHAPVRILPGVPYAELVETLNAYDLGVYTAAPISLHHELSLPNKIFDYIQARLGLVVTPMREITRVVEQAGIGAIARDFSARGVADVLDGVTVETVRAYKEHADSAAPGLSSDRQQAAWEDGIRRIVRGVSA